MADYVIGMKSGKEYEASVDEVDRLKHNMKTSGKNYAQFKFDNGRIILLQNVEVIEPIDHDPIAAQEKEREALQKMREETEAQKAQENQSEVEKKRKEMLDEMTAKSNCQHDNQIYMYQVTSKGKRFFPVCEFCGQRFRNVKSDSLTKEEREEAKPWNRD